jgi:hypothetical protein
MRALVIAFALLSLTFLVLAVRTWRGGLILTGVTLLSLAAVWWGAGAFGWGRDRALWVAFGACLALATVIRPWWFWENYKARWLRGLIGDEGTALVYLVVAGVMVWVGMFTNWHFGRD